MKHFGILLFAFWLAGCMAGQRAGNNEGLLLHAVRGGFFGLFVNHSTYLITSDGTGEISMNLPSGLGQEPRWSSDGQWIVFTDEERDRGVVLHFMRSDGSHRIEYQPTATANHDPTWAPDGKSIAYYAYGPKHGIQILNVECLFRGEVCQPKPMFLTEGDLPNWSPDGKHIAYTPSGYRGISVISADGTGQVVRLAPNLEDCLRPQWSPDGEKIAFSCRGTIYTLKADGSELKKVTDPGGFPTWSPNGSRIAFVSGRDGLDQCVGGLCGSGGIYSDAVFLMDADGSNVRRLSGRNDEEVLWYTWLPSKDISKNP